MKYIIRFLLSPFIIVYGIFLLFAGTIFPLVLVTIISGMGFFLEFFILLFKASDTEITGWYPLITYTENNAINHLLGATIYIWLIPYMVWLFITTGQILFNKAEQN